MLSKLALLVSSGSHLLASTSRVSRSRTDRSYSARLRRWKDRVPGSGFVAAARSTRRSRVSARATRVSPPGRLRPGGGIIPARSFAIIFSAVSGVEAAAATSKLARTRLPDFCRSLWQVLQVALTTAVRASLETAGARDGTGAWGKAGRARLGGDAVTALASGSCAAWLEPGCT